MGTFFDATNFKGRVCIEFHLSKLEARKGAGNQEIILNLGLQPGLKNHFHQVATPTRGKAKNYPFNTVEES